MNDRSCVLLTGRQNIKFYDNIIKILDFLNADLFLIYEEDICNYLNYKNLKDSLKVPYNTRDPNSNQQNLSRKMRVKNQYDKLKLGWELIEAYENKNNFQYKVIYRLRPDIFYELDDKLNFIPKKNEVYLNSDKIFYGLREHVKYCFLLYEYWNDLKKNNKEYDYKFDVLLKAIDCNLKTCFVNKKKSKYLNKLKSIPIPSNKDNLTFDRQTFIDLCSLYKKTHVSTSDVLKDNSFELKFFNEGDRNNKLTCELHILLVLLCKEIVPVHSSFITAIKKISVENNN